MQIRVLIVDDHPVLRESLRCLIETEPGLIVVGVAENGAKAVRLAEELTPDIIIMDIHMPVMDGVEAVRVLKSKQIMAKIIMLTTHVEANYIANSVNSGADKFMDKDRALSCLLPAIRGFFIGIIPLLPLVLETPVDL
jgi:DNA-binding NarL/FixJ family response regulator